MKFQQLKLPVGIAVANADLLHLRILGHNVLWKMLTECRHRVVTVGYQGG